jgi:hypothetical protein
LKPGIRCRWELYLIAVAGNLDGGIHHSVDAVCVLGCSDHKFGRVRCRDSFEVDDEEELTKRENPDLR